MGLICQGGAGPEACPVLPIMRSLHVPDTAMRQNLKVPFAEKDDAKKLGARWDAGRKLWYVDGGVDLALFERWQPTPHDASVVASSPAARRGAASSKSLEEGKVQVGSRFVALPRVCDCLPWNDCEKCRLPSWPDPREGR